MTSEAEPENKAEADDGEDATGEGVEQVIDEALSVLLLLNHG